MLRRRWTGRWIARVAQVRDSAITQMTSVLASVDPDLVIDVIDEIDDPQARKATVSRLLVQLESEQEAVRVGRRYDFDRDCRAGSARRGSDGNLDALGIGVVSFDGSPPP